MDLYKTGLRPTSPTRPITPDCSRNKTASRLGMWQKLQHFFGRDGSSAGIDSDVDDDAACPKSTSLEAPKKRTCPSGRPVGVGLPRQTTFKRQNSEKRERLCPIETPVHERRALSASRPRPDALTRFRTNSLPPPISQLSTRSAPAIAITCTIDGAGRQSHDVPPDEENPAEPEPPIEHDGQRLPRPASVTSSSDSYDDQRDYFEDRSQLNRELETKWILNLSMHFRDKSDREKFFVTYAETPTRWRRVTVSCDYRNAEPGSLEMDLKELQLQRDKSMQIYEAVRESLREIKFYDTVTNLKLETRDGRLHVHVTEDMNEIIPYPPIGSLHHILNDHDYQPRLIRESELSFEAHLSGFVYKVSYNDHPYIKKEIPGPDTVDEFLYEVNALHALQDCQHVINLEAIITDDSRQIIKGLLINYAEQGAVVDLLYDYKGGISWEDREKWARHVIQGLSDIHEAGYVQGDFTLSNIVVDRDNNARIIDINRRGCPVGWEPPEIAKKIASNQRISMYIGQKSDLYQLGMSLWALAMDDDEPERHDPPLSTQEFPAEVPTWYRDIVRICLSPRPRDRLSATDLMKFFPLENNDPPLPSRNGRAVVRIRTDKQYIDPAAAVERDDLERFRHERIDFDENMYSPESSREDPTFTWPQSSNYDREFDSTSSDLERPRGRRRISDRDLQLQAQQRSERLLFDESELEAVQHEPVPMIFISSDGTESHIVDLGDAMPSPTEEMDGTVGGSEPETSFPFLDPILSSLQPLSHRTVGHEHSEVSEDTPRNSSLQLQGSETSVIDAAMTVPGSESVPDDLAGFGAHPNLSRHSLEQLRQETHQEAEGLSASLPSLPFHDSGYNDVSAFGLELELDDDVAAHGECPLSDMEPNPQAGIYNSREEESEHFSWTNEHQRESSTQRTEISIDDSILTKQCVPTESPPYESEHKVIIGAHPSFESSSVPNHATSAPLAPEDSYLESEPKSMMSTNVSEVPVEEDKLPNLPPQVESLDTEMSHIDEFESIKPNELASHSEQQKVTGPEGFPR